jgi:tRNA1(Val) A37 N6-methylase TrmN6
VGDLYRMITNDVSDYINLLVRFAHIICNHPYFKVFSIRKEREAIKFEYPVFETVNVGVKRRSSKHVIVY